MARRRRRATVKKGIRGTRVKVKGHSRSPRGPNAGKKAVFVKGYNRRKPRKKG